MPAPLSQIAIPVFSRGLTQLGVILDKAADQVRAKGLDEAALLACRLAPDMFPLSRQVHLVADFSAIATARLAGLPPPGITDTPATIAELKGRLAQSLAFIRAADPAALDAGQDRPNDYLVRGDPRRFDRGLDYLLLAAMPNFHFHLTTAYAILRHEGVALVKGDFIGGA